MSQELNDLGIEIASYVYELHDLTKVIKDMDAAIIKESTPENQMLMQEVIDRYKSSVNRLKVLLECYFLEEQNNGILTDFSFRKLYKQLKAAY